LFSALDRFGRICLLWVSQIILQFIPISLFAEMLCFLMTRYIFGSCSQTEVATASLWKYLDPCNYLIL